LRRSGHAFSPMIPSYRTFHSGDQIPAIGLGLWKIDRPAVPGMIRGAIEAGYRHFDCACDYGNEAEAGVGFRQALDAGLCKREDLASPRSFRNTYHASEHVYPACERTLNDLGVDYLDLYLVHFPSRLADVPFRSVVLPVGSTIRQRPPPR